MRTLVFKEYQTGPPVELSVEQRDALIAAVPDIRLTPEKGQSDRYLLTPGSTIGAVALPGLAIEIAPKLAIERVLFLVSYSLGLAKWSDDPFTVSRPDSLVEAMVPVFARHLEQALRRGVLQGYRTSEDALMGVRGRVRFDDQVRKRFGVPLPVEVRYDEFTEDILENRLLKSALGTLGRLQLREESSRRALRRFNHVLELVAEPLFDCRNVPMVGYTRLNEHYRGAVEWARFILQSTSIEAQHGRAPATAVLFDMNRVFEEFVRIALREELGLTVAEFPSGKQCRGIYLDAGARIRMDPDLSWWSGNTCRLIGDVKYKAVNVAGVKHPDLYQLLAYVTAVGLPNGLLVYAAGEGEPAAHEVRLAGKVLHVRSLEMAGPLSVLRAEIRAAATLVQQLASANARAA